MESSTPLTPSQRFAIAARGNVLVAAGAGTGKTLTLVERCLALIEEGCQLEEILMVTFTEAAAAEMRQRIRLALEAKQAAHPVQEKWAESLAMLDTASISTLHAFCAQLVREDFHQLGIDPSLKVLDESQAALLSRQVMDQIFEQRYQAGSDRTEEFHHLIRTTGHGSDAALRRLALRVHNFVRTLASPEAWLRGQWEGFQDPQPTMWKQWLVRGFPGWARTSLEILRSQPPDNRQALACASVLETAMEALRLSQAELPGLHPEPLLVVAVAVAKIRALDQEKNWPHGTKGRYRDPIKWVLAEAEFLSSLVEPGGSVAPMQQDWTWARRPMIAFLDLVREFGAAFDQAKRELSAVDFADLEQHALRLLRHADTGEATPLAQAWRRRIKHVFVDEYQDINAAQDAILRALSREGAESNRCLVGDVKQSIYRFRLANPSIFRHYEKEWAEGLPHHQRIFLSDNFRSHGALLDFINAFFRELMRPAAGGIAYGPDAELQSAAPRPDQPSFSTERGSSPASQVKARQRGGKSSREKARNASREMGNPLHLSFDDSHEQRLTESERERRVELHLLAPPSDGFDLPAIRADDEDGEEAEELDLPAAEKEARLVALRLRELKEQGYPVWDSDAGQFRPMRWRDVVILLRSPKNNVESYAKEFYRLSVPLHAPRGGFYEELEVMDLLNLIRLLDNPLQDIPLVAVLRSPLAGLTLDELAEIRAAHRQGLYWAALQRFHAAAPSASRNPERCSQHLKRPESRSEAQNAGSSATVEIHEARSTWEKVDEFLKAFHRWRELIRQTSLSQCLEAVLEETHYEALLQAGPRGPERLANLRQFQALARQYDPYQRQGVYRFLNFVAAQQEVQADRDSARVLVEDAVQLLSIHRSKGLEFPIVVLAGLGRTFNVSSLREEILLDEEYGLCPRVSPPDSDFRYPSLPYWLARKRERAELLGEEMRLLYVAMTRARDKLVLAGRAPARLPKSWALPAGKTLTDLEIASERSFLGWIILWLRQQGTILDWSSAGQGRNQLASWRIYPDAQLEHRQPKRGSAPVSNAMQGTINADALRQLRERMEFHYPHSAAAVEPGKTSVSSLRRRIVAERTDEAAPAAFLKPSWFGRPSRGRAELSSTERGTAHHAFLQHAALENMCALEKLGAEAERLVQAGILTASEKQSLDLSALLAFWNSGVGQSIWERRAWVHREMPFTARISAADLAVPHSRWKLAGIRIPQHEFLVVQGVVDLAVLLPEELWIIDFKTDQVTSESCSEKTAAYEPQLSLYAWALERIYRRPVTSCWLHFLSIQQTVPIAASEGRAY